MCCLEPIPRGQAHNGDAFAAGCSSPSASQRAAEAVKGLPTPTPPTGGISGLFFAVSIRSLLLPRWSGERKRGQTPFLRAPAVPPVPPSGAAPCARGKELRGPLSFHAEIRSRKVPPGICSSAGSADGPASLAFSCFPLCPCIVVGRGTFGSVVGMAFVGGVRPGLHLPTGLSGFGAVKVK